RTGALEHAAHPAAIAATTSLAEMGRMPPRLAQRRCPGRFPPAVRKRATSCDAQSARRAPASRLKISVCGCVAGGEALLARLLHAVLIEVRRASEPPGEQR